MSKKRPADNIHLAGLDELLGTDTEREAEITEIPLGKIRDFRNHPFRLTDDAELEKLSKSIQENGVLSPVIVRETESGYELLSGHRRCLAAKKAGLDTVPAVVRECSDDEAIILMVDSNLQREGLTVSERARSYRMKYDAMLRLGLLKGDAIASMAFESGDDERTIRRYINISRLTEDMMDLVDKGVVHVVPAEILSVFDEEAQEWVYAAESLSNKRLKKKQAQELRKLYEEKLLTEDMVKDLIFNGNPSGGCLKLDKKRIRSYFPADVSSDEMEQTIYELLDKWAENERSVADGGLRICESQYI